MYAKVQSLPACLQSLLSSLGYHKPDVEVIAAESTYVDSITSVGSRAAFAVLNLATGESRILQGSWGGPNPFETTTIDRLANGQYAIPPNGAVVKGVTGGHTWLQVYVRPDTMAPLLPPAAKASDGQLAYLFLLKSVVPSYRKEAIARVGVTVQDIDSCVAAGWAKRNKAGATSITTEGKNVLGDWRLTRY